MNSINEKRNTSDPGMYLSEYSLGKKQKNKTSFNLGIILIVVP